MKDKSKPEMSFCLKHPQGVLNHSKNTQKVFKMYKEGGNIVIEEDEQLYGEEMQFVDKKIPCKKVPYSAVFD